MALAKFPYAEQISIVFAIINRLNKVSQLVFGENRSQLVYYSTYVNQPFKIYKAFTTSTIVLNNQN